MLVLPAYFDGDTVKTVDNYKFSKDQKLMITVLDEAEEKKINDYFTESEPSILI